MSTMTKAGIPVDTGFAKRRHEHAERKARQVAFNNKVREFHATDRGVKATQKKRFCMQRCTTNVCIRGL